MEFRTVGFTPNYELHIYNGLFLRRKSLLKRNYDGFMIGAYKGGGPIDRDGEIKIPNALPPFFN